jgi:hypothetical protein
MLEEPPQMPGEHDPRRKIPCGSASTVPNLGGAGFEIVEQPETPLTESQLWGEEALDSAE